LTGAIALVQALHM